MRKDVPTIVLEVVNGLNPVLVVVVDGGWWVVVRQMGSWSSS
jgi:hypothetical protein